MLIKYKVEGRNVTILYDLTSMDDFYEILTSINIPDSVTSIKYDAFEQCESLEYINTPNAKYRNTIYIYT